jgi:hypothetical protein
MPLARALIAHANHRRLIVEAARRDFEDLLPLRPDNAINEAVLIRNSTSPPSRKVALERFRLSDALKRGSTSVFDDRVQPT